MDLHTIRLSCTDGNATIEMDGKKLRGVQEAKIRVAATEALPTVTLTFVANVEVDTNGAVICQTVPADYCWNGPLASMRGSYNQNIVDA